MHWLVQIALYNDHLMSNLECFDNTFVYALDSYLHYIRGDDDGMEAVDREFMGKLEKERDAVAEGVKALEKEVVEREGRLEESALSTPFSPPIPLLSPSNPLSPPPKTFPKP